MVTSTQPSGHLIGHPDGQVPFSFADDLLDRTQPVRVILGGFEYPGEVIVARQWRAKFGRPLSGVSMFRLVLLHSTDVPAPEEITDDRICVAAPRVSGNRVGDTRATYSVNASGNGSNLKGPVRLDPTAADIRSLREVRRNYVSVNDPGLGRLASALATYESQVNESMATDLHEKWKSGVVVTSPSRTKQGTDGWTGPEIQAGELFLLGDPVSWIESAAAVLDRNGIAGISGDHASPGRIFPEQIFEELQAGRLASAREQLRQLCRIRIDEPTPVDRIDAYVERGGGEVSGDDLVQLLIHELGFPPAVASLWLVGYALVRGSELELVGPVTGGAGAKRGSLGECLHEFLSGDTISEFEYDANLIARTANLRAEKSDDWDAVLPFLKLVAPLANFTAFGGGRESDTIEFELQLATLRTRMQQASPVMLQLEVAAGAADRPLTRNITRLSRVLSVESWREYVVMAREIFGSVGELKSALIDAAHQWSAVEYAADIERTVYYLDQVEFGRVDHALAVEHRVLRSRFDLRALVENPHGWRALRDEFERWRQEYRKAYLEDHSRRQQRDLKLRERIECTTRQVLQIDLLERIDVLRSEPGGEPRDGLCTGAFDDIPDRWNRVTGLFRVCESDGSDIRLIDGPVCPGCKGRLGQATNHNDVTELIAEVAQALDSYRDRLATVVSDLVLNSENSDRLQKLFRLNSAGDLSDLANVLDDKVISFLNELFGNASGNLDDWTLPHS